MQNVSESKTLEVLLNQYNKEIDNLKDRLLNGESWDNLKEQRHLVTQLAIAIHKSSRAQHSANPAESTMQREEPTPQ